MKKNLTLRYSLHQGAYCAAVAGIMSFATTYLLYKGFPPGNVGALMAMGTVLSCITQPLLAAIADRSDKPIIPQLMALLTTCCIGFFGLLLSGILPNALFPLFYLGGVWVFDTMTALNNSISVYYNSRGYYINYGAGRGIGSAAYALSALAIGAVMEKFGADWMLRIILIVLPLMLVLILGYPKVSRQEHMLAKRTASPQDAEPCTIPEFFSRYKWFCISLFGVLFLAMFHVMIENYLIAIMSRLGGDSSHVGIALSLATIAGAVVFFFLNGIRRKFGDNRLMKLTGFFFLLKSILITIAPSIEAVYAVQLLQVATYSILSPVQVYYADARVSPADMVKGQAFINAAYTLGCAGGNFFGGQFMQLQGVELLLSGGIVMASLGTLILVLTVDRKDA